MSDVLTDPNDFCPACGENDTDNLYIMPEDNPAQIFEKEQELVLLGEPKDSRKDVVICGCGQRYLLN